MKTYKEYMNTVSWDSSFAEQRKIPTLSWDSSFAEQRKNKKFKLNENATWHNPYLDLAIDYDYRHDNDNIKTGTLSKDQLTAIYSYTSVESLHPNTDTGFRQGRMSSKNLNNYLRNRDAGEDISHPAKKLGFISSDDNIKEEDIKDAVEILASCFTPEHLNKSSIITYCAVPPEIGKKILSFTPDHVFHLAAFTSTSLDLNVALGFAYDYGLDNNKAYIIRFKCDPGSALSIAKHSIYNESEMLLRFGTKVRYNGKSVLNKSEVIHSSISALKNTIVLDCSVFPIKEQVSLTEYKQHAKELNEYGPYHHPVKIDR